VHPKNHEQTVEHERKAWAFRCRGWSQNRIAAELGLSQPGVCKMLGRIESRELKRLTKNVERLKVSQNGQLEHVIEEAVDAWHRSKTPKKRAARRTTADDGQGDGQGGGGEVQTTEIIERDGDPSHLYCAMVAMGNQRSLWGLDVMPALSEPAASVAELARDLLTRGATYENRKQAEEGQGGHPAGDGGGGSAGTPAVSVRSESVQ